jgi:predicted enzyme related to lactoylglutathione lyase
VKSFFDPAKIAAMQIFSIEKKNWASFNKKSLQISAFFVRKGRYQINSYFWVKQQLAKSTCFATTLYCYQKPTHMEKRVTGIGGIFFKAQDQAALNAWYSQHLGFDIKPWGAGFEWQDPSREDGKGYTAWSIFKAESDYFNPSEKPYMFNYRVADLHALLAVLRQEGVHVMDQIEESEYGKFGWIMDPEGNKIELWEPPLTMPEE